jgi:hypothetical protein
MLLCVGGASLLGRLVTRLRPVVPIAATFLLSLVYSMTLFVAFNALRATIPDADPAGATLPGAVYDAILAGLIGPIAVAVHDRRAEVDRVDW